MSRLFYVWYLKVYRYLKVYSWAHKISLIGFIQISFNGTGVMIGNVKVEYKKNGAVRQLRFGCVANPGIEPGSPP